MNKRLAMLEKMFEAGQADSFVLYALAMEYRKEKRTADAMKSFEELREKEPSYLPQYLMAGQILTEEGRATDAKIWLEQGLKVAATAGDAKTLGELEAALEEVSD
ncbi:MAG: tetratricopeptide repeat protein [Polyangiaceae bacterium]|nr:tetratricopeptide repeat protein [Polyangiaceae bacterium]